uniref:Protein FAM234A n=1 Tax=Geotrypetes seraphini TaxID=260995 RepID=A0A6P8N575_GEOSA|nr:protein FAM234A [Geotrypetes seraphini]XP_033770630.1 protein FAM234A [Geotrypetes seraphini]XP_033770631.1 protein FAM234A [Geotrypetes seraphini]XP_033770632.1 protein FAM234A [Geotrypetes seraphini]
MHNKDLEAEIHPLKHDNEKAQENCERAGNNEVLSKKKSGLCQPSQLRTAAFFITLFLCLAMVFAFSFIIPCPVRPVSEKAWIRQYNDAVTHKFLAVEDVNEDKVKDLIFVFSASSGSNFNKSCSDKGFSSPCAFVAALSGTNGSVLWEEAVTEDITFVECSIKRLRGKHFPGCLVIGKENVLIALDSNTGKTLWKKPSHFGVYSSVMSPLLSIPDVDGDGIQDILIFTTNQDKIQGYFYSGGNGDIIGQNGSLSLNGKAGYLLHVTKSGSHYLLFYKGPSIDGYALENLYTLATGIQTKVETLKQDPEWEKKMNSAGYVSIPISSSEDIRYLVKVPGDAPENLLVVTSNVSQLLDGQSLHTLWTVNTDNVLSEPTFGYYKKTLSIIIETGAENNRKKVVILSIASGKVQWETELESEHQNPKLAVLHTVDSESIFLFWGNAQTSSNDTELSSSQNLYMFYHLYPEYLLQLNNSTQSIVAFDALLFENSRHAGYALLTGPLASDAPGTVTVSKQKLKEDITKSRVIRLGHKDGRGDQEIRGLFSRVKYSSDL